jgi:hypothetical protein
MNKKQKEQLMEKPEVWGRIFAIIDRYTPGGLTPSAMNQATMQPGLYMGQYLAAAQKRMSPDTRAQQRMCELMDYLSPDDTKDVAFPLAKQGDFQIAFYHERKKMDDEGYPRFDARKNGRPTKDSETDWAGVDWGLADSQIAPILGVSPQAVRQMRKKLGK